jgi:glycosyltransferase involved in cell wall biosynthesis
MTFSTKVLLLIPNLGMGGAQRVFHDHSVELAKHYAITEAVFNLEDDDLYPSGNPVVSLDVRGGGGALAKLQNFRRRITGLRQLRERLRPVVVISHLEGADYVNLLSGGPGRTILCVHGSKLHDANIRGAVGWLRKNVLIPILYRRAARIVTVSAGIWEELVRGMGLPAHKVQVINNFFDTELIRQQADTPVPAPFAELANHGPVLVTAGRLSREKNLLALLDVFQQVRRQVPTCRLLIIGQGEEYAALIDRCQTLELTVYTAEQAPDEALQAAVLFTGFQANPHAFIAKSTLFVLPSLNEGFPMALGEAMICGLPVAAADCPTGPREILAPATPEPTEPLRHAETASYGVLLPVISSLVTYSEDVAIWSQALTTLLLNPVEQDRLREQARQRMNDFSRQRIAGQWFRLVEEVRRS